MNNIAKFINKYEKSNQCDDKPRVFCHENIKFYENVSSIEDFYDEHQDEIWDILNESSEWSFVLDFLAKKFDAYTVVDNLSFKNFMIWKALEVKCHMMSDFYEEQFNKKIKPSLKVVEGKQ